MKKIIKSVTKETFYRQWEETLVGLKIHIHRKHVQVSRKHYLLQVRTQQTFQYRFNVVFWLMRRCDLGQRQINVETTLYISTLEFTTSNQRCVFQR